MDNDYRISLHGVQIGKIVVCDKSYCSDSCKYLTMMDADTEVWHECSLFKETLLDWDYEKSKFFRCDMCFDLTSKIRNNKVFDYTMKYVFAMIDANKFSEAEELLLFLEKEFSDCDNISEIVRARTLISFLQGGEER